MNHKDILDDMDNVMSSYSPITQSKLNIDNLATVLLNRYVARYAEDNGKQTSSYHHYLVAQEDIRPYKEEIKQAIIERINLSRLDSLI